MFFPQSLFFFLITISSEQASKSEKVTFQGKMLQKYFVFWYNTGRICGILTFRRGKYADQF